MVEQGNLRGKKCGVRVSGSNVGGPGVERGVTTRAAGGTLAARAALLGHQIEYQWGWLDKNGRRYLRDL